MSFKTKAIIGIIVVILAGMLIMKFLWKIAIIVVILGVIAYFVDSFISGKKDKEY